MASKCNVQTLVEKLRDLKMNCGLDNSLVSILPS